MSVFKQFARNLIGLGRNRHSAGVAGRAGYPADRIWLLTTDEPDIKLAGYLLATDILS